VSAMSTNSITISVTQTHIECGARGDEDSCPIAMAMRDAGYLDPEVYEDAVVFFDGNDKITYKHSSESRDFINTFDTGGPVTPTTFVFDAPYYEGYYDEDDEDEAERFREWQAERDIDDARMVSNL
jgi:hypothetical protein